MADLKLYHAIPSRAATVRWMLEEIGEPYDIEVLDLAAAQNRQPAYLAVNPMGKVPTLIHRGVTIAEVAAICCYLADEFPHAGLTVPVGDRRRGPYLRWMFFAPSVLEPSMLDAAFPRQEAPPGAVGWRELDTVMDALDATLRDTPYLLGDAFTAADLVLGSTLAYGRMFNMAPPRPAVDAYIARFIQRPALLRSQAKDKEDAR